MKVDSIKQYLSLQENLRKEKKALEARLAQIEAALGAEAPVGARASGGLPEVVESNGGGSRTGRRRRRARNPMSLRKAVVEVTRQKALTKPEILEAIAKLGYRFTAKNPVNSLNALLYSKKQFKNNKGRFCLAAK